MLNKFFHGERLNEEQIQELTKILQDLRDILLPQRKLINEIILNTEIVNPDGGPLLLKESEDKEKVICKTSNKYKYAYSYYHTHNLGIYLKILREVQIILKRINNHKYIGEKDVITLILLMKTEGFLSPVGARVDRLVKRHSGKEFKSHTPFYENEIVYTKQFRDFKLAFGLFDRFNRDVFKDEVRFGKAFRMPAGRKIKLYVEQLEAMLK